jgi:hypothetical protein
MAFTWLNTTSVNYESSKLEGHRCNNNKSWCIKEVYYNLNGYRCNNKKRMMYLCMNNDQMWSQNDE